MAFEQNHVHIMLIWMGPTISIRKNLKHPTRMCYAM